jgi:hypothetical protein
VIRLPAALCALALLAACGHKASPRKERIARLPDIFLPMSAVVSDDRSRYAYLVEDADGVRMIRDGSASEDYRRATNRNFSPNAHHHVYWAQRDDNQPLLVVDDLVIPIGYSRHEYVVFDPSGTHWAALASPVDHGGAIILRDGATLGPFADASVPAWSPTATPTLAYLRVLGEPLIARRTELVVGDTVVRENTGNAPACVPALGEPFEGPELPRQAMVRYLSDGRLVSVMPLDARWALRRDAEVLGTFDATAPTASGSVGPYVLAGTDACQSGSVIAVTSVTTAERAPVVAWWERPADGPHWRVMVDGRPALSPPCLRPWPHQPPQLTADGKAVSFPCSVRFDDKGEAIKVIHGLRAYGPYPEVWALALSDDGSRLAYGASDGTLDLAWAVYADGVQVSERYYSIWRPRFDPTGRHLGWEAMRSGRGPNILVLDGRPLASFDDLIDGPIFDRPGEVAWIIRRKRHLARINFALR